MLSLYIHIPFCRHKCKYCSFFVMPEDAETLNHGHVETMKQQYTQAIMNQIVFRKEQMPDEQIKTIYVGGGTPFQLCTDRLITLIETIFTTRDCTYLEELTIELNPDPIDHVLDFVEETSKRWSQIYRLRFSFGIQSFDDHILQSAKRGYTFDQLPDFFRALYNRKQPHVCYNADFIAFWQLDKSRGVIPDFVPRWTEQRSFFEKLVRSHMMDSFSLYTLELFPWSDRYNDQQMPKGLLWTNDDTIASEFERLKKTVTYHGYQRHELSNFALKGKQSIHNMIYRTMQPYLWLGINASSMLPSHMFAASSSLQEFLQWTTTQTLHAGVRFKSPDKRKAVLADKIFDEETVEYLNSASRLTEELMLILRTTQRITDRSRYSSILEPGREHRIDTWTAQGYLVYDAWYGRQMTDQWMDLYNTLITDLILLTPKTTQHS